MPKFFGLSFGRKKNDDVNKYIEAFLKQIGGNYTQYDTNASTYLKKGFLFNPDVYSIVQAQATKAASIPWKVINGEDEKDFPMPRPNQLQTWSEIKSLSKVFLKTTGNIFFYKQSTKDGANAGVPQNLYVLPSHLMKIVLKQDIDIRDNEESPISHYMLIEGSVYTEFAADDIIHIKYANPDFDFNGSHLYGLSPLRPLIRNIQSSNEAIDNNNRMMLNSGAFGFITGTAVALTEAQAAQVKERLTEMRGSKKALGHIQGASAPLAFTKVGLSTDELKQFDFLKFDQKQLCNALSWSDKLLNNDDGAKYDNINQFRKQVITDNMIPDNQLINEGLTIGFVRMFKGYETSELISYYDELPEMQNDMTELTKWITELSDRAIINRDEAREKLGLPMLGTPEMQSFTVKDDVIPLEEAIDNDFNISQNEQA